MRKLKTTITITALAFAASAVAAGPASAQAAKFGSSLSKTVQPSNASQAHPCRAGEGGGPFDGGPAKPCTWVMNSAYKNPGGEGAPKRGKLRRLRLIAGEPGAFRLQIARVRPNGRTKVVRQGPRIKYIGQQGNDDPVTYRVERFKVNVPIKAGERLAIRTKSTSTLRCSSGGPNTYQFTPPLRPNLGFVNPTDSTGCWLLLEGIVR